MIAATATNAKRIARAAAVIEMVLLTAGWSRRGGRARAC